MHHDPVTLVGHSQRARNAAYMVLLRRLCTRKQGDGMSESIQIGDRVTWISRRRNARYERGRIGTVTYVRDGWRYATVKPDKGHGHRQMIALARLTKVEAQP
jgi:hypothetical protein